MSCYEKISCRVAIQVCIGHFPDGRERHRTFSMRGVNPDASPESIAAVVRALAPVLAYPITKVRKVVKRRVIIYEEGVVPWDDAEPVTYAGRIVPFPSGRTQFAPTLRVTVGAAICRPCLSYNESAYQGKFFMYSDKTSQVDGGKTRYLFQTSQIFM